MADPQADSVKSTIIMKVDSPVEDKEKDENEDNEKNVELNSSPVCSPFLRRPIIASNFGNQNPFAIKSNNILGNKPANKSVLRPSQLGQASRPFTLNPSKLNPFAKTEENCSSKTTSTTNGDAPKFVPLLVTEKASEIKPVTTSVITTQTHSFVFGQNLQERVMAEGNEEPKPSTSVSTNGTSNNDMLFSSAIKDTPAVPENSTPIKSLSESAREYEEQRANKRKYEEVEVKTGEEDETNILHLCCKLFAFDKAVGNWQERGRGNLRLNDLQVKENDNVYTQSRLVFRSAGVLRVIINTKIWAEMTVEQASAKSVRFTALDSSGEIKVFLVMANPEEIKHVYRLLQERLLSEQRRQNLKKVSRESKEEESSVDDDK